MRCGQSFACSFDFLGFAYFGSDMSLAYSWLAHSRLEQFWWCAEGFLLPCGLVDKIHVSLFSSLRLGNVPGCQVSRFSLIYTAKEAATGKVRFFFFFNWMGRKHFLFQCILRFWMKVLDSRESFHFLWSPYTEGVTFMPVLETGRGETWKIEWPGYPEVSRDWKWSPPQINGFLGN